jgi:hypothetical protein
VTLLPWHCAPVAIATSMQHTERLKLNVARKTGLYFSSFLWQRRCKAPNSVTAFCIVRSLQTKFNPLTAILFTLDFFLLCLNVSTSSACLFVCLFVGTLFNDAVSNSDHKVSNCWVIVNNELERMWKEAAPAYFKVFRWHFPGGTEENQEKSLRIISVSVGIQTGNLPSTIQKRCRMSRLVQFNPVILVIMWRLVVWYKDGQDRERA